jgi:hypothetical protein
MASQVPVRSVSAMKLRAAAKEVREGIDETLTYYAFPDKHHHLPKHTLDRTRVAATRPERRGDQTDALHPHYWFTSVRRYGRAFLECIRCSRE